MLEVPLGGGTSDPSERSGITAKFAFAAESFGGVDAKELQATYAIEAATEMVSSLHSTPQIVGQVDSVIATGTKVATEAQTSENVPLKRTDRFNHGVAEVSGIQRLAPSPSKSRLDSSVSAVCLVGDIVREPGVCVTRHSRSRLSQILLPLTCS